MKLSKEAKKIIKEMTKDLSRIDKSRDKIEPYWSWESDGIIDRVIKDRVTQKQFKYFEACKFKVKALWYIKKNIEEWDEKNRKFVALCVKDKNYKHFQKAPSGTPYLYYHFPFFEAVEFENLLFQGKAFLDSFSKAVGCIFKENPNDIPALLNMLKEKEAKDGKAKAILAVISSANRLEGILLHPKREGKKSVRDLITHREKVDIKFWVWKGKKGKMEHSNHAVLEMWHPEIAHLHNYLVTNIASKIWYYALGIMVNTFKVAFDIDNVYEKYL